MQKKPKEIWLPIIEFPKYEVSNLGRIRNIIRKTILGSHDVWKKTKGGAVRKKCRTVTLYKTDKRVHTKYVHFIVLNTFKPRSINSMTVDHIDRDPFNNKLNNLRWATKKTQTDNRVINRKVIKKLTMEDLNVIYNRTKSEALPLISKDYNIDTSSLCRILRYMHPLY